jgi:hypothetical protein
MQVRTGDAIYLMATRVDGEYLHCSEKPDAGR